MDYATAGLKKDRTFSTKISNDDDWVQIVAEGSRFKDYKT